MRQKEWDSVYHDISYLAHRRTSLPAIHKHLTQRRHFSVSVRSLRSKLRKWNLRVCDINAANLTSGVPSRPQEPAARAVQKYFSPKDDTIVPTTTERSCTCANQSISCDPSSVHVQHNEIPETYTTIDENLGDIYHNLLQASASGKPHLFPDILQGCTFRNGSESILHYAIKAYHGTAKHQLHVVGIVLEFLAGQGCDANHEDAQGRTAVELAIASRSLAVVETVVKGGAALNRPNSRGDLPLHTAISTRASPDVYRYLLGQGADANASILDNERRDAFALSMPLSLVLSQLGASSSNNNKDSTAWFKIAGHLIEHSARYTVREAQFMLAHFAQAWLPTGGTQKLWDDARILLSALIKRGMDPTAVVPEHGLPKCDCGSLAHMAFFHSRSEAFGRWIIEVSTSKHGEALVQCLLKGCADTFIPRSNANSLLRLLMKRDFQLAEDFNAVEYVLQPASHNTWEQKAALINTLMSVRTEQYIFSCADRRRHGAVLELLAACPFTAVRCRIAEDLLQKRISSRVTGGKPGDVLRHPANRPFSDCFAELATEIESSISHQHPSAAMYDALHRILDYHGPNQKSALSCFIHFVTLSMIQGAESGGILSKPKLCYLLKLRREFELPDVHLPNTMILDMLKGAPEAYAKLKELEKFFTHDFMPMFD